MKMLISVLLFLNQVSCSHFQVHPFEIGITLPYSEICHFRNVMTGEVRELGPIECAEIRKRSLILTSDAWRVIRTDIMNNCALNQCTQLTGKLDAIFLAIDQTAEILP